MENNENFVAEQVTENVEQTTEQSAETPKTYTQAEVDLMVKEKLDQVLPGKISRTEAKIRKENDRKYGELVDLLRAGTGKQSVEEITDVFKGYYQKQGVTMPEKPKYTEQDIKVLAQADADEIIRGGFEDVVEEADRLKKIGVEKMTAREKAVFVALTNHIQKAERGRELSAIGVTEDVYGSKEFNAFAAMFNPSTPIREIYSLYEKTKPKKEIKTMGSMRQNQGNGAKDYYSQEEIERLDEEDLKNPNVWEAVRRSMTGS